MAWFSQSLTEQFCLSSVFHSLLKSNMENSWSTSKASPYKPVYALISHISFLVRTPHFRVNFANNVKRHSPSRSAQSSRLTAKALSQQHTLTSQHTQTFRCKGSYLLSLERV
jgi:hypothetical protein